MGIMNDTLGKQALKRREDEMETLMEVAMEDADGAGACSCQISQPVFDNFPHRVSAICGLHLPQQS